MRKKQQLGLFEAIRAGELKQVKDAMPADINAEFEGRYPLLFAVEQALEKGIDEKTEKNRFQIVEYFLTIGNIDVNIHKKVQGGAPSALKMIRLQNNKSWNSVIKTLIDEGAEEEESKQEAKVEPPVEKSPSAKVRVAPSEAELEEGRKTLERQKTAVIAEFKVTTESKKAEVELLEEPQAPDASPAPQDNGLLESDPLPSSVVIHTTPSTEATGMNEASSHLDAVPGTPKKEEEKDDVPRLITIPRIDLGAAKAQLINLIEVLEKSDKTEQNKKAVYATLKRKIESSTFVPTVGALKIAADNVILNALHRTKNSFSLFSSSTGGNNTVALLKTKEYKDLNDLLVPYKLPKTKSSLSCLLRLPMKPKKDKDEVIGYEDLRFMATGRNKRGDFNSSRKKEIEDKFARCTENGSETDFVSSVSSVSSKMS